MKTLEEYINEQLFSHLCIDYNIYENAGLYDGIEDLCNFLTNKIRSHQEKLFKISYTEDDRELSKFKNIFFKKIILTCERSNKYNNDAEYTINSISGYDSISKKFNIVRINVFLSQKHNPQEVYSILLHELTHAWDNYNAYKNNTTNLNQANRIINYPKILNLVDYGVDGEKILGDIMYFLNDIELNAWVASFAGYLYEYDEISTPQEALKIIKNSDLYKNYINIGEWVTSLYNNDKRLNQNTVHQICNSYNKLYNTDYTEYKIKKILYNKYIKAKNKIDSSIGKLCSRYVKELKIR